MNDVQNKGIPVNRNEKRGLLQANILKAAFSHIEENGLKGLRARDIASEAGCSLGSLYNAYKDLDDLILHVNSQILTQLSQAIGQNSQTGIPPRIMLSQLAKTYLDFAYENYNLWSSLFTHEMQDSAPIPDWYVEKTNATFSTVVTPLMTLRPDLDEAEAFNLVRTLFSAVHGIITINLQERFISIPREMLEVQLEQFVTTYVKGLAADD
jgi:AcrR family transcriptional regulator